MCLCAVWCWKLCSAYLPFSCPFTNQSSACAAMRFIWTGIEGSCKVVWCQSWSESLILLWVATWCDVPVSEWGRDETEKTRKRRCRTGLAEQHECWFSCCKRSNIDFLIEVGGGGSGERKWDGAREKHTYPRVTERYGKYWRGDGKRDVELFKEEEQVAVLDRVDKAQTS